MEEDYIIATCAQEDVETLYNLLKKRRMQVQEIFTSLLGINTSNFLHELGSRTSKGNTAVDML